MKITISEGKTRFSTAWTQVKYTWDTFAEKLKAPLITSETAAQYAAFSKDKQSAAKDVGGFVGGRLKNGRRSSKNVISRSLITLDADYADEKLIENLASLEFAAVVYSTHSSRPDALKLRVILPLNRPVSPEEYGAVSRLIADMIGFDYFDKTTFQPERLMYWPSVSKDAEYYYKRLNGSSVNADEALSEYENWRDVSSWRGMESETNAVLSKLEKQSDPLKKEGIVGAFCRTYTILEAIEKFIPDKYKKGCVKNRLTYTGGSTSDGALLFDEGRFLYSYHDTDPANNGHLLNAFDLIRVHKFGVKDKDAKPGTPAAKLPSYIAMTDFASKDEKAKKLLFKEREKQAQRDFADGDDWVSGIKTTNKGIAENTHENIHYILNSDPKLKGAIRFNEFTGKVVKLKDLPWYKVSDKSSGDIWSDADDVKLLRYLERYNKRFTRTTVLGQVLDVASVNSFHPVRDYLKSLKWDGVKRLEHLFIDHLGASDTEYVRTVTRKALTAAVTRVFSPGAKFDYMTVLVGAQGVGKSSILRDIAKGWFTDNVFGVGSKEAMEQIQGFWIVEMAELAAMKKTEVESVKMFVGSQVDSYRAAYGRNREERPRQCVFFGTTNATAFLRDETGNRRFWPITVRGPYRRLSDEEIDQIWAEAVYYQSENEPLYLDKRIEAEAARQQEAFEVEDPWAAIFIAYLEREIPEDWYSRTTAEHILWLNSKEHGEDGIRIRREAVTASELWEEALEGNKKDLKRNMGAIHAAMTKVPGWERLEGKVRVGGKVARAYGRVGSMAFAAKEMATKAGYIENDGNA